MKQPITVHLNVRGGRGFNTPLCGTNAGRYQTSRLLDHVTCQWCLTEVKREPYWCVICDQYIVGEDPHTDDATGEDCHADCCITCNGGAA